MRMANRMIIARETTPNTDAEKLACIQEQIAKQFGILECTAYTAQLECAVYGKDAERCTLALFHRITDENVHTHLTQPFPSTVARKAQEIHPRSSAGFFLLQVTICFI